MRRASAAVLRPADVAANFRVDRTGFAVPMVPVCADYPGDRSGTTVTGEARSAFRDGTPGIGSKVLFFKTPPDLDRYWALTVRNRFASCFAQKYDAIERPGFKTRTFFATRVRIGATGVDRAVAYRTITKFTHPMHEPIYWYQETVFLHYGRALGVVKLVYASRSCTCFEGVARRLVLRMIDASQG